MNKLCRQCLTPSDISLLIPLQRHSTRTTKDYPIPFPIQKPLIANDWIDHHRAVFLIIGHGEGKRDDQSGRITTHLQYSTITESHRGYQTSRTARPPSSSGITQKGRKSIKIWAQSNARLASLYKRKKQPEVAVPLLVEIIRLMTPNSTEGKEAYENLLQLGFVDTIYKGF